MDLLIKTAKFAQSSTSVIAIISKHDKSGDLPDTYTNIKPTKLPTRDIFAPSLSDMCISKLSSNYERIVESKCEISADEIN